MCGPEEERVAWRNGLQTKKHAGTGKSRRLKIEPLELSNESTAETVKDELWCSRDVVEVWIELDEILQPMRVEYVMRGYGFRMTESNAILKFFMQLPQSSQRHSVSYHRIINVAYIW